ncbi:MAG: hypothetical protein R3B06_21800 [Kofleriaceae bacterium]
MPVPRLALLLVCGLAATATAQPARTARPGAARAGKAAKIDLAATSAALVGTDVAAAAKAAATLGGSKDAAFHEPLRDLLATGAHPDVVVAGLTALAATAQPADVALAALYQDARHPQVRAAALRIVLATKPDPAVVMTALRSFDEPVRAIGADAAGAAGLREAVPALLVLLDKGELPAARALAKLPDETLAKTIAARFGIAPDAALAVALGGMLVQPSFSAEPARLEVVRTLTKLSGIEPLAALEAYVKATPATPPTQSRREADGHLKSRQTGDR